MKLEIEITEDEIRSAMERKVRAAVADETSGYGVNQHIKERIRNHWKATVEALVIEALSDSPRLREKITEEIEKKLRSQISALSKKGG